MIRTLIDILLIYPLSIAGLYLTVFVIGMVSPRRRVMLPIWTGTAIATWLRPIFGGGRSEAITSGYCTLYLVSRPTLDLILHENFHQHQSEREAPNWGSACPLRVELFVGALIYGAKYVVEYVKHGYRLNKYEIEARVAAGQE